MTLAVRIYEGVRASFHSVATGIGAAGEAMKLANRKAGWRRCQKPRRYQRRSESVSRIRKAWRRPIGRIFSLCSRKWRNRSLAPTLALSPKQRERDCGQIASPVECSLSAPPPGGRGSLTRHLGVESCRRAQRQWRGEFTEESGGSSVESSQDSGAVEEADQAPSHAGNCAGERVRSRGHAVAGGGRSPLRKVAGIHANGDQRTFRESYLRTLR
jgi:hypothetical protein